MSELSSNAMILDMAGWLGEKWNGTKTLFSKKLFKSSEPQLQLPPGEEKPLTPEEEFAKLPINEKINLELKAANKILSLYGMKNKEIAKTLNTIFKNYTGVDYLIDIPKNENNNYKTKRRSEVPKEYISATELANQFGLSCHVINDLLQKHELQSIETNSKGTRYYEPTSKASGYYFDKFYKKQILWKKEVITDFNLIDDITKFHEENFISIKDLAKKYKMSSMECNLLLEQKGLQERRIDKKWKPTIKAVTYWKRILNGGGLYWREAVITDFNIFDKKVDEEKAEIKGEVKTNRKEEYFTPTELARAFDTSSQKINQILFNLKYQTKTSDGKHWKPTKKGKIWCEKQNSMLKWKKDLFIENLSSQCQLPLKKGVEDWF